MILKRGEAKKDTLGRSMLYFKRVYSVVVYGKNCGKAALASGRHSSILMIFLMRLDFYSIPSAVISFFFYSKDAWLEFSNIRE
jgi:hypothetical protein